MSREKKSMDEWPAAALYLHPFPSPLPPFPLSPLSSPSPIPSLISQLERPGHDGGTRLRQRGRAWQRRSQAVEARRPRDRHLQAEPAAPGLAAVLAAPRRRGAQPGGARLQGDRLGPLPRRRPLPAALLRPAPRRQLL